MRGVRAKTVYPRPGSKEPIRYYLGDKEVTKEEFDAAVPSKLDLSEQAAPDGHRPNCWPMVSEALAVHPSQVDEANERARKAGIGVKYQKGTGLCQIDSAREKAKLVKLEGFFDKQAGYQM